MGQFHGRGGSKRWHNWFNRMAVIRHTHTLLLIEANVHIKEIQERLGHSDISTTMDIYAHMTKNIKKEASTKFSNLMKDLSESISNNKDLDYKQKSHEHS